MSTYKVISRLGREEPNTNGYFIQNAIGATVSGPWPDRLTAWREADRLESGATYAPGDSVCVQHARLNCGLACCETPRDVGVAVVCDECGSPGVVDRYEVQNGRVLAICEQHPRAR